ncbi:MAG: glycosyltransferase family protein [Patescibacteria group bacterium]
MKYNNLCIIQARTGSTRLPNKVLLTVKGRTLLEYEIERVKKSKLIDKIVVATTFNKGDDKIETICKKNNIDCFRGSEEDVLDRYYQCSLEYPEYKNIIRITGDCPLIDPTVVDNLIKFFVDNNFDYASNIEEETFPDGMDAEIFKREVLAEAAEKARLASQREHVTLYIRNNEKYGRGNLTSEINFSHFRLTVDEKEDYEVIKFLIENSEDNDRYMKYISLLEKNPEIMNRNIKIQRNMGLIKSLENDEVI